MSGKSDPTAPSNIPLRQGRLRKGLNSPRPEEGTRLVAAFLQIEDAETRMAIVQLAEALARARHRV